MQKSISETAKFIKELISADTLEGYTLKPLLASIANEENIRSGVLVFKDFLYELYGQLITNGALNVTSILINIGYYGYLTENGNSLALGNMKRLRKMMIQVMDM